jgi:tetratricopeptide (TPR) repeat protein
MNRHDLIELFSQASRAAEHGDLEAAAMGYENCLSLVRDSPLAFALDELAQFLRSAAINSAQVLNKLGRYGEALNKLDFALSQSPTPTGTAIMLAAKAEAFCGLGNIDDGMCAFREAIRAHPIVGSLNSADSMSRLKRTDLLAYAQELVQSVLDSHGKHLDAKHRAEAYTIFGRIAVRRALRTQAMEWFTKALTEDPEYEDARQQMRELQSESSFVPQP